MKRTLCTLFDKNYLPHLFVLKASLEEHVKDFLLYCFCMDEESFAYLTEKNDPNLVPISRDTLENHFEGLKIAKTNRSKVEYYFTCSSSLCGFILDNYPNTDIITYLDADLRLFSSPEPIFNEMKNHSIGIIAHKFYGFGKRFEKYGKYNVGWLTFVNDENSRKCLTDWRNNCINWCYDRLEDGKFADQKYLEHWHNDYKGVHEIKHIGANVAPWNVGQYKLTTTRDGKIMVNDQPLIFYHFSGFKQLDENTYTTHVSKYLVSLKGTLKHQIYIPYIKLLNHHNKLFGYHFIKKERNGYKSAFGIEQIKKLSRDLRQKIYLDTIHL